MTDQPKVIAEVEDPDGSIRQYSRDGLAGIKPPEHDCPLCGLLGRIDYDDPWRGNDAAAEHDALLAFATAAELKKITDAAAEHRKSHQAAADAVAAHRELHDRLDGQLIEPIIVRRVQADSKRKLAETRGRLLQLLGQDGPEISLTGGDLQARLEETRRRAADAESDWQIVRDYGIAAGLIDEDLPF